jgi:triosephosphate isomerase
MNGSRATAIDLVGVIVAGQPAVATVLCPPAPYLADVVRLVQGTGIEVGGQNCSEHASGAYTGEVAAGMLRDCGASHVILGHSERRQLFGDDDARVLAKVRAARAANLRPILCVGETLSERRAGATEAVVGRQLAAVLAQGDAAELLANSVIAYEPVWAIGTGEAATPEQAQAVHAFIRATLAAHHSALAAHTTILYGGSVKADNAAQLFAMPDIDGGLIGGASLDGAAFLAIGRAAAA